MTSTNRVPTLLQDRKPHSHISQSYYHRQDDTTDQNDATFEDQWNPRFQQITTDSADDWFSSNNTFPNERLTSMGDNETPILSDRKDVQSKLLKRSSDTYPLCGSSLSDPPDDQIYDQHSCCPLGQEQLSELDHRFNQQLFSKKENKQITHLLKKRSTYLPNGSQLHKESLHQFKHESFIKLQDQTENNQMISTIPDSSSSIDRHHSNELIVSHSSTDLRHKQHMNDHPSQSLSSKSTRIIHIPSNDHHNQELNQTNMCVSESIQAENKMNHLIYHPFLIGDVLLSGKKIYLSSATHPVSLAVTPNNSSLDVTLPTTPSHIFPVGLSRYHLSAGSERLHLPFLHNDIMNSTSHIHIQSPNEMIIIPIIKVLDAALKTQSPIEDFHKHQQIKALIEQDLSSTPVLTHTPCFICLPVQIESLHSLNQYHHETLYSPTTQTSTMLCVLRSKKRMKSSLHHQPLNSSINSFHLHISDSVEFQSIDLALFIKDYCQMMNDYNVDYDHHSTPSSNVNDNDEQSDDSWNSSHSSSTHHHHNIQQDKHHVLLKKLLQQYQHSLGDAIWEIESIQSDHHDSLHVYQHPSKEFYHDQYHVPIEMASPYYRLKNGLNEYLLIDNQTIPQDVLKSVTHTNYDSRLDQHLLQYSLLLNQYSELRHTTVWIFHHTSRPYEPVSSLRCPTLLQSPNPLTELSFKHRSLYHSFHHIKHPFESLPLTIPIYLQELLLVEDLLYCFMGIPGELIHFKYTPDEMKMNGFDTNMYYKKSTHHFDMIQTEQDWKDYHQDISTILFSTSNETITQYFDIPTFIDGRIPIEPSLLQMVQRILSICRMHRKLIRFIEIHWDIQFGVCSQALADTMKQLLTEFQNRIIQLESQHHSGELSLQKLWFYLQPAALSFQLLEKIIDAVKLTRGGLLLNQLHHIYESMTRTDPSKKLCRLLLEKSIQPLSAMLLQWIQHGVIHDPHDEFFITTNLNIHPESKEIVSNVPLSALLPWNQTSSMIETDDPIVFGGHPYWHLKFIIKQCYVPFYLKTVTNEILNAGKHLSVLSTCQHPVSSSIMKTFDTTQDDDQSIIDALSPFNSQFKLTIQDAALHSSQHFMKYLTETCDLPGRLRSIRRFMFFSRSDNVSNMFALIEDEIQTHPISKISCRLNYLLESAMGQSSLSNDPYRSDFKCTLSQYLTREISPWFTIHSSVSLNEHSDPKEVHSSLHSTHPRLHHTHPYHSVNTIELTHDMIALATGLHDLLDNQHSQSTEKDSESKSSKTLHPLFTSSYMNPNQSFHYPSTIMDSVSSSSQTSIIERFQELLKYLTFSFEFKWPLGLIFPRVTILKYQLLSRLVLQLKFTEKKLAEVWQTQMRCRGIHLHTVAAKKISFLSSNIRLRMLHFVRNFIFYITIEVLEPRFHDFFNRLAYAESLDTVIQLHNHFLDTCLHETLLTEPDLIRSLSKVLTVCHLYTSTVVKFSLYRLETAFGLTSNTGSTNLISSSTIRCQNGQRHNLSRGKEGNTHLKYNAKSDINNTAQNLQTDLSMSEEKFGLIVKQYSMHFERNLKSFLVLLLERSHTELKCSSYIYNLLTRLDFNGFYSKMFKLDFPNYENTNSKHEFY